MLAYPAPFTKKKVVTAMRAARARGDGTGWRMGTHIVPDPGYSRGPPGTYRRRASATCPIVSRDA